MTPEQLRVAYHSDAAGNPAVAEFRAFLTSGKAAEDKFYEWLALPMTQLVVHALEELADNPSDALPQQDVLLQYGVTSGLQIAVKLMTQPKRLYPELFKDPVRKDDELDRAYTANADSVIDNM